MKDPNIYKCILKFNNTECLKDYKYNMLLIHILFRTLVKLVYRNKYIHNINCCLKNISIK